MKTSFRGVGQGALGVSDIRLDETDRRRTSQDAEDIAQHRRRKENVETKQFVIG